MTSSLRPGTSYRRLFLIIVSAFFLIAWFNLASFNKDRNSVSPSSSIDPNHQTGLILTLVRDNESWGGGRSFHDFLSLVQGFDFPMTNLRIGILASDKNEYNAIKDYIQLLPKDDNTVPRIQVLLREKDISIAREDRKEDMVQRERRRLIARLRNFLLYSTLREEDFVLWIDSDMIDIPGDILPRMVNSGKDIITTATRIGANGGFYDLNAWAGERAKPNAEQQKTIEEGGIFVPYHANVKFTHQLEGEFGRLDSVGGTVLFVKSEVHREGAAFTTNYVIGSGWKHEGYDGIETEGLCYVAGFLGYECWGMPNAITIHSDK